MQATEKTGEVGALAVVQLRGGQATDARQISEGLDARHGEFLWQGGEGDGGRRWGLQELMVDQFDPL
ncbi:hypothetical protein D3C80_2078970 [compost metagenome]